MRYSKIFFVLLFITFTASLTAQDTQESLNLFSEKFIAAIRSHNQQRTYLVTDKSIFAAGEVIWFKAFLLNSVSQKITTKNSFLFVDLVNEKDSVLTVIILDAGNPQLSSRIILPDSANTGYYWLRAYTRQMAENDTNSIAVKPIYIVGKTNKNIAVPAKNNSEADSSLILDFYPEGGSIITGANSTVALRISNKNGEAVNINGVIKDNRDTATAQFATNAMGLAKFTFEPSRYRKYRAVINWQGKETSYTLPQFNFFAGQLAITKQPGDYKLRVLLEDSIYKKDFLSYVIGICKDSLVFVSVGKGMYETTVAENKLPDGITTFFLFDKDFNPLSERSVYVHDNNLHINISTDKNIYAKRDKVTFNISITDGEQHLVPSLVAVSVIDTLFSDPTEQCGSKEIVSTQQVIDNMFLTRNGCLPEDDIDLLMLSKNNSYQTLSQKMQRQAIVYYSDSLLYLKGVILTEKNEPAANKLLTLISNSGDALIYTDTTDINGRFRFPIANYIDSTQFAIEIKNTNGRTSTTKIIFDPLAYPKLNTPVSLKQYLPVQNKLSKRYLNTFNDTSLINWGKQTLPPVTVKDRKKAVTYDVSKRISSYSSILTSDDIGENNKVGTAVLRIPGLQLLNGYLVTAGLTSMGAPNPGSEPMLLVDGVEIKTFAELGESSPVISYLNSLNSKDIDFIEVLKGADGANYGVRGGNGVILVNTANKRKDLALNGTGLKIFYAKGISNPALFPNTNYQQKEQKTSTRFDNRSTIFWNGSYLSDDAHNATLNFYTSDIPATYKATITGITVHGGIIYKTMVFHSK